VRIERPVLDVVLSHARECQPKECCGILLANVGDLTTIVDALRADNIEPGRPTEAYLLDHRTQLRALDMEIEGRMATVGYYHSHPRGDARPSRRDVELAVPDTSYLIVGMGGGSEEYATWRVADDGLVREPLEVTNGNPDQTEAS
jgi:proteasome lid subunit RPN8/RPN11